MSCTCAYHPEGYLRCPAHGPRVPAPILVRKGPEGHWWVFLRGASVGHPWRFWLNAIWSAHSTRPATWGEPLPESLAAL